MTEAAPVAPARTFTPRQGLLYAFVGLVVAVLASNIAFGVMIVVTGRTLDQTDDLPLTLVALLQVPLWSGLLGAPLWASAKRGTRMVTDFGLRVVGRDIPIGLFWGALTQLLLVPLLYLPLITLFNIDSDKLDDPAKELSDRADSTIGVILLILVVVIGAPIIEEIFYRGLLQRSLGRLLPAPLAIGVTATVFGLSHLQLLQLPALILFGVVAGVLAQRSGRLGPSIFCHMAFNAVTIVVLLASR